MINSYKFGQIIVRGEKYTTDVIIYPDRINSHWWRKKGHELNPCDIEEVLFEKPEILVVGKGFFGIMKISPETKVCLTKEGITLKSAPTKEACQIYNQLYHKNKVIAALHLTC